MAARNITLLLCDNTGKPFGTLPPFAVDNPWWPEVLPVVEGARERFGVDVFVLRLLEVRSDSYNGGDVTYAAEVLGDVPGDLPLTLVASGVLDEQPLRARWARPGALAASVAWADGELATIGRPRTGPVVQIKTWNLSSVLRVPTADGAVWCKSVPPFLVHEGAIVPMVADDDPSLAPAVLASDPSTRTVLFGDAPGEPDWDAPPERLVTMIRRLVDLQARWAGRTDELLAAGLPDRRARGLCPHIEAVVARADVRVQLTDDELAELDLLIEHLPERFAALEDCGLPDTLVHGDFHPGNWFFDGDTLVLLDWGDCGVGSPMLDVSAFEDDAADDVRALLRSTWVEAWQEACPGSDPGRALELIGPISALNGAVTYQGFLDGIEPSERIYHATDPRDCLRTAIDEARGAG